MAPVPGISQPQALEILRNHHDGPLTLDMGSPHRDSRISFDGTHWRLCAMVADPARIQAESARRRAAGLPFMAEHAVALQEPGPALIEETDKNTFVEKIGRLPWNFGGPNLSTL